MRKVILKESTIKYILNESLMNNYTEDIVSYLDNNFLRSVELKMDDKGFQNNKPILVRKLDKKTIEPSDLFYFLQDRYKDISADTNLRDQFIRQVIKDWYSKYYKKHGSLSRNIYI